ncbi:MAG: HEPN domain-containing protein [Terracidiphilus sp.]
MNRNYFQQLAELRLKEARALLAAELPDRAYYLAGYAVECALKACIAKMTQQHDFPDKKLAEKSYTHDVERLLEAAGLSELLKNDLAKNEELELDWETVREWSEQSRYDLFDGDPVGGLATAQLLIDAVESEEGGVLRWIR